MKYNGFIIALCLLCMSLSLLPIESTRATPSEYKVDISTSPANGYLNANNLKPGDQINSKVHVNNESNTDFNYTISARWESGSKAMFNQLQLVIADNEGVRFSGKLSDLQLVPIGEIDGFNNESLKFTVDVPESLGNEYQGVSTRAIFVFQASPLIPSDNCFLPPFSNKGYSHKTGSVTPIKFQAKGKELFMKLIGPDPNNRSRTKTYQFHVSDGAIVKEGNHYKVTLSGNYPAGKYEVIVYSGKEAVCHKDFTIEEKGNRSNSSRK
ncbi:hypothetical protein [Brevibacillus nitrificans]|uniref:hypothetical protein n=1 Tax=Brevibacillus nitrificans TaxID=651560 RepID=UPI00285E1325|nr:hypothetical protein [Brevibacillus nitrificans]MDR7319349.1 hypothetical protein [Brevibacillus nitrificans]